MYWCYCFDRDDTVKLIKTWLPEQQHVRGRPVKITHLQSRQFCEQCSSSEISRNNIYETNQQLVCTHRSLRTSIFADIQRDQDVQMLNQLIGFINWARRQEVTSIG